MTLNKYSSKDSTFFTKPFFTLVPPTVSLDLFGLKLAFDGSKYFLIEKAYTPEQLLNIGASLKNSFVVINQKGYVPEAVTTHPIFAIIKTHLVSLGYKIKAGELGLSENTYSLWFNLIKLNLFLITSKVLNEQRTITPLDIENESESESEQDILTDLENLMNTVFDSLDPYLKVQIQKRGISVIENTYTGFDTEYTLSDIKKNLNKLLSVQSATQTRTIIKLPMYDTYDIAYVHPLTSELTTYYKPRNPGADDEDVQDNSNNSNYSKEDDAKNLFELQVINQSLKWCIERVRKIHYESLDTVNAELIEKLHDVPGITFYQDLKRDQIIFALPLTKVKTKIQYPNDGYSLKTLVCDSNSSVIEDLETSFASFVSY